MALERAAERRSPPSRSCGRPRGGTIVALGDIRVEQLQAQLSVTLGLHRSVGVEYDRERHELRLVGDPETVLLCVKAIERLRK